MDRNNYAEVILIYTLGNIQQDILNLASGKVTVERMIKEHQYLNFDIKKSIDDLKQKEIDILDALQLISSPHQTK